MIKITNISKSFISGDTKVNALKKVSFEVAEGKFASIIGKSGSGKSTLMALLGALDKPDNGSIEVDGKDITKLSSGQLTRYRAKQIGFVFQSYNLVPNLTALENVCLAMEYGGMPKTERRQAAIKLLNSVGLKDSKQDRLPAKLSGGEQQRVAIARALANKPKLILADEPTGNLDSETGKKIFDLLHDLAKSEKTTIIAVTHDLGIAGKTDLTFEIKDGSLSKLK
jgi:putative ABC transport system ATP-binding protein